MLGMSTSQAYTEGFFNRASEYGFSYNEAVKMLKNASLGKLEPLVAKGINPLFHGVNSGNIEKFIAQKVPKVMTPLESAARGNLSNVEDMVGFGRVGVNLQHAPVLHENGAYLEMDKVTPHLFDRPSAHSSGVNSAAPIHYKDSIANDRLLHNLARLNYPNEPMREALSEMQMAMINIPEAQPIRRAKNWNTVFFSENKPAGYGDVGLIANQAKMTPEQLTHMHAITPGKNSAVRGESYILPTGRTEGDKAFLDLPSVEGKIFYEPQKTPREIIKQIIETHGRHNVVPYNRATRNKLDYLKKIKGLTRPGNEIEFGYEHINTKEMLRRHPDYLDTVQKVKEKFERDYPTSKPSGY